MANGDAATAAGMDTVAGTADLRAAYDEENKGRDYLAEHMTNGTHDASAITSGVLDAARVPDKNINASQITSGTVDNARLPTAWTKQVNTTDLVRAGNVYCTPAYSNILTTSYRALYVTSVDGLFGHVPSARRYKKNIKPVPIDPAAVLSLVPVEFDYLKKYGGGHDVGLIAEEVAEAGLGWLTMRGAEEGVVDGIAYERLAVALLAVVRDQHAQLEALDARVAKFEGSAE